MSRTALYRHFDADGKLLYVGVSLNAVARLSQHKLNAGWFGQIASVTIEWLGSRHAALDAELRAIRTETPAWNKVGRKAVTKAFETSSARISLSKRKPCHVVLHLESGRYDGFYVGDNSQDTADGICSFLAETYPRDRFAVAPVWRTSIGHLADEDVLRPSNERKWSITQGLSAETLRRERSERLLRQHPSIAASLVRVLARHTPAATTRSAA